jgi:ankyrin repeat protein
MTAHSDILGFALQLGYKHKDKLSSGLSIRWLEASILGEIIGFDNRIQTIRGGGLQLAHSILEAEKNKWKNITEVDKHTLLDIRAFFDSLMLFQQPSDYVTFVGDSLWRGNVEALSRLASSDEIQSLGGLAMLYSAPGIYTQAELKQYLDSLGAIIESTQSKEPVGMLLSSRDNTIALSYRAGNGWQIMDINQYSSLSFEPSQTDSLAVEIAHGLRSSLASESHAYSVFNTSTFTTGKNLQLTQLKEALAEFKGNHVLTESVASPELVRLDLADIAVRYGHIQVVAELAKHGVDFNMAKKGDKTPAYIAARYGHTHVIAQLAQHGVDLNKARENGAAPAFIAAQNGHAHVIAELAKHDAVELNKARHDGTTPAYVAAYCGHANVITELAQHGVDLNMAKKSGATPAHIAAKKGHANVITELAKHDVDLNKTMKDGATPIYAAAQNGHANVIAELAKHGADLNKAMQGGATPAFVAAQNGHVNVIADLAKHGVDFNLADDDDITPAYVAAYNGRANVIDELANHGVDLNKAGSDGLTPAFVAAYYNGHANVIASLMMFGANFDLPYKSSDELIQHIRDHHEGDVIARLDRLIQRKEKGHNSDISITPKDIAFVMGHEQAHQLLQKTQKIGLVFQQIKQLRLHGEQIAQQTDSKSKSEGGKAIALAGKLNDSVKSYILALTANPKDDKYNATTF